MDKRQIIGNLRVVRILCKASVVRAWNMGYMMRAVVLVAQLGLLRAFSSSFLKDNVGFELSRGVGWNVKEQPRQNGRLNELASEGNLVFSTSTMMTFCAYGK